MYRCKCNFHSLRNDLTLWKKTGIRMVVHLYWRVWDDLAMVAMAEQLYLDREPDLCVSEARHRSNPA